MCLYLTFMYKTMGCYNWMGTPVNSSVIENMANATSILNEPLQEITFSLKSLWAVRPLSATNDENMLTFSF